MTNSKPKDDNFDTTEPETGPQIIPLEMTGIIRSDGLVCKIIYLDPNDKIKSDPVANFYKGTIWPIRLPDWRGFSTCLETVNQNTAFSLARLKPELWSAHPDTGGADGQPHMEGG
jgi:hypothetical protein